MDERVYTVNETFDVLKRNKITSNIESVRRWLRGGTIKGIAPVSRKEGWKVTQTALDAFLAERLPDAFNTTTVANENALDEVEKLREQLHDSRENELRVNRNLTQHLELYNQLHEQLLYEREQKMDEEAIRADERAAMWYEITRRNIWEGYVEIKKSMLKEVAEHRGYSQQLVNEVWERCVANSTAYKQPRVSYLLDAFSFEGKRLLLDQAFTDKWEQIVYAIFEHVKSK